MTEEEWLGCDDPERMLRHLTLRASERKCRLFACACCQRIWHLVQAVADPKLVAIFERLFDGIAPFQEIAPLGEEYLVKWEEPGTPECYAGEAASIAVRPFLYPPRDALSVALQVQRAVAQAACSGLESRVEEYPVWVAAFYRERAVQADLVRDIFGNPFHKGTRGRWTPFQNGIVFKLALLIHRNRVFDDLPILGDALEDAGCSDEAILLHLRSPGPHVRGCWAIDLILGRH